MQKMTNGMRKAALEIGLGVVITILAMYLHSYNMPNLFEQVMSGKELLTTIIAGPMPWYYIVLTYLIGFIVIAHGVLVYSGHKAVRDIEIDFETEKTQLL